MKTLPALVLAFFSLASLADVCSSRGPNVILLTLDGVRSYEFFKGTGPFMELQLRKNERGEIFNHLWSKHAREGIVLGANNKYRIGSDIAISLPSYQAMMVGESTPCTNNGCPGIDQDSMLESIREGLTLSKNEVAVFASWEKILLASAKAPSNITHGIFPGIMEGSDDEMLKIQLKAMQDLPQWGGSRKDEYTFALGMHYLKTYCPRVLWISLVDSDEFAHHGNYPGYIRSLKKYDEYLDGLLGQLKKMGDYGAQTTVIMTTDHSRGPGPLWRGHANTKFSEKKVFLFATGRGVAKKGQMRDKGSHLMLRPTIEGLMGLTPRGETLPGINFSN